MSNNDKNKTGSHDIIEEIIPGKNNNDNNNKSINQNKKNNQLSNIENYNEEESAQAVIETSEESKKTIQRNTEEAENQAHLYVQATTDVQEKTAQTTKETAENYIEFQKQAINSFQTVFMPYFQNIQNQLWNNQEFFNSISQEYYRLISSYTESAIAFSRMWNNVVFTNAGLFKNVVKKPN